MERRASDVQVTFKRKRLSDLAQASKKPDGYAATATQLESIAPTQAAAPPAAALTFQQHKPAPQQQHCQQPAWGLHPEDAKYYKTLDEEQLLETASLQTTPAASRAASPRGMGGGLPGPCTAPQPSAADLAALISQQLGTQHSPCSAEIVRHYPRVQEQYRNYQACMAEQQLSPMPLRQFFKHTQDRGVPAL